ncbi:radical SAM protein [Streptomyces sp. AV19]|uniref:coproporphyrinogen-III oxidase family protein n=1 Tax=Streptomyces sp. AV19 TaxID=2793068 RepID=UPI0018FE7371|nr:radical SAM protein [Streptomyces sp. AV19]MBH1934175.1 radical SAM protein [Streptomyces sp. AV19]MDG4533562.1 radical SAM protein [Streptomyces sp. AV19]
MLSTDFVNSYLDHHLGERQVNKIQHGFPSPRYWNELSVPLDEIGEDRRSLRETNGKSPVFLYIGVPYCIQTDPGKCGYCLFPVEEFQGNAALENYYGYVEREAEMYREQMEDTVLVGAYFGGGTSNLYKAPVYHRIMDMTRSLFPEIAESADLTLEGIPQLFSRAKMEAIRDSGMNRISMGVQQVNERLNSFSGRKQTTKHVIQSLEWARELGLAANVDIIFGWPQQTVDTMLEDLETLVSWDVYDITHYELNVGGPTDFALNRFHELPSTLANLEMYRAGRDFLLDKGYEQLSTYNFRRPGDPAARDFREGYSRFGHVDTLGLGYAAITFFGSPALPPGRSWSFINHRSLPQYKAAVDAGRFPVERGYRHTPEDFLLMGLFRSLISREVDRVQYRAAFGLDIYEKFATIWDVLAGRGYAEITPERIELVGDGAFYAPMFSALFAEERYRELREEAARRKKESRPPAPASRSGQ